MGHNPITLRTALEIIGHEAIIRRAYKDSVGWWSWSVGLTSATGHMVERYIDNPQTLERCLEVYLWALDRYADAVREVFEGFSLVEEQFTAALSFHWNTGRIKSASWPKLWKAGQHTAARKSFASWRTPAEVGRRRDAEVALFFDGEWSSNGTCIEYTALTKNYTPVWKSGRRIDVKPTLMALLRNDTPIVSPESDRPSRPNAITADQASRDQSFWRRIWRWLYNSFLELRYAGA